MSKNSEKVFFNADIRKSNASPFAKAPGDCSPKPWRRRTDKRRFVIGSICDHLRTICENLRSRRVFQKSRSKIYTKGLTLAELLLAAAILAFVLCGLLVLFANCVFLNESNRNLILVVSHAQYVMEDIKNNNFSEIKTKIDNGDWDWATADIAAEGLTTLTNESIDTSHGSVDDPLEVTVTVSWEDQRQRQRQTELRTLITK